ncbi:MAG: outer membrane lipoprotein chaperone LolA [Gammaproteobacteria bacterium]
MILTKEHRTPARLGRVLGAVLCGASVVSLTAAAQTPEEGQALIQSFLDEVTTLKASFAQTLLDEQYQVLAGPETGTLAISRPGRFRWDYREPAERLIIADGTRLWMYEPDLDQVIVRNLDTTLASTPAMLLSGEGGLSSGYEIISVFSTDEIVWVELRPKVDETDFETLRLGFVERELAMMDLVDRFGQTTHLEFNDVERNVQLDEDTFDFSPPEGADVIGDTGF